MKSKQYRPCVACIITDASREQVLVFQRIDRYQFQQCWQFPQGGLEASEEPIDALYRELAEEIGTNDITILNKLTDPIAYTFSEDTIREGIAAHYCGQNQYWFLALLNQPTSAIHFNHLPREFDKFKWVSPQEAIELAVPFKQDAYTQALSSFGLLKHSLT